MFEDLQTLPECCSTVANEGGHRFCSFDIMSVNVESRLRDDSDMFQRSGEITSQRLNEDMRSPELLD